jgi:hypothetical protein
MLSIFFSEAPLPTSILARRAASPPPPTNTPANPKSLNPSHSSNFFQPEASLPTSILARRATFSPTNTPAHPKSSHSSVVPATAASPQHQLTTTPFHVRPSPPLNSISHRLLRGSMTTILPVSPWSSR